METKMKLSDGIDSKILEISGIMSSLLESGEKVSQIVTKLLPLDTYDGNGIDNVLSYYAQMGEHLKSLTLLYSLAMQQAFTSIANIRAADEMGGGA